MTKLGRRRPLSQRAAELSEAEVQSLLAYYFCTGVVPAKIPALMKAEHLSRSLGRLRGKDWRSPRNKAVSITRRKKILICRSESMTFSHPVAWKWSRSSQPR